MFGVVMVGDVKVCPPSVAALTAVLQVNPVLVVQFNALALVLQLGIENAVGAALDAVAFVSTVLAPIAAIPFRPTPPHAGALDAPVDTMANPDDDPVGLSNWTGTVVVAAAVVAHSAKKIMKRRFMLLDLRSGCN
jgi:hypothetical protein